MAKRLPALLGLVFALALRPALAADSQGVTPADAAAIRQVIERQMDAFRRDDGATAFGYASPLIQEKFGNPDRFMAMVRSGYPQVYRPQEVEFEELAVEDIGPVQNVRVIGPDGVPVMAIYLMQRQTDGSWRINGCYLIRIPNQSA